jgi:hypothetical protein
LKGFGIFMLGVLMPVLAYALWNMERLPVAFRWTMASLLVGGAYAVTASMYFFGPHLPPAVAMPNWTTFSPPKGGYSISMPGPTIVDTEHVVGLDFTKHSARVKPNQMFIVAYADATPGRTNWSTPEHAFAFGRRYLSSEYPKSFNYGGEQQIKLQDEFSGVELSLNTGSGRSYSVMTVRMYLVGNRLYILIVSEMIGNNGQRFFDSFRVDAARTALPSPQNWPGLVAYWSFDEGVGAWVKEERTFQLSPMNDCQWTTGRHGKGVQMIGGFNSHIQYGERLALDFKDKAPFTFAGWCKTDPGSEGVLVSQRHSTNPSAILNIAVRNGRLTAEVHQDGQVGNAVRFTSNALVADGEWHHFALTREPSSVNLYVDGVREGRSSEAGGLGPITTNLRAFGCDLVEQQVGFNVADYRGSLDEICIFNRALSDDEIKQLAGKKR